MQASDAGKTPAITPETPNNPILVDEKHDTTISETLALERPSKRVRFRSLVDIFTSDVEPKDPVPARLKDAKVSVPRPKAKQLNLGWLWSTLVIGICFWLLRWSPLVSSPVLDIGVEGGVIKPEARGNTIDSGLDKRQSYDPTNYCKRWAHQSAMVNGTVYIYGGRMTTSSSQTSNTWNNGFLTLDVTKTWQISSPPLSALPQPSGPPAVALGYLWHSFTQLFLYGGEYSDTPVVSPSPYALWTYDIPSKAWSQTSVPSTSDGNNTDVANQPVLGTGEGAGISIPSLGRGYYFGGHQDYLTTSGWSYQVQRKYLKSLLEYTYPGFKNNGVGTYANTPTPSIGAWRNITTGGIQKGAGFSERADGVLIYVPGFGLDGILLGIGGGTNVSFPEMNIIDVYDIATSTWYQQATSGAYPQIRVNPCAVAASAPDGSSTNIYMFGGQNLQPAGAQTQYDDMWILSVPSFNWINVDTSNQSTPPGRAGHTCEVWDGQMIVIGGYVGAQISCESPGIFVFDMSELKWVNQFSSLTGSNANDRQSSQANDPNALAGSYGYRVPAVVQSVIGGSSQGGATATAPVATASAGPLATGSAVTYTVTQSNGAVTTQTSTIQPGTTQTGSSGSTGGSQGPNIAAIVAGTIAGVLFLLVCYLGFCTYIYKKQLRLYKNHVVASQRAAAAPPHEKHGLLPALAAASSRQDSSDRRSGDRSSSYTNSGKNSNRQTGGRIPPVPSMNHAYRDDSSEEDLLLSYEPTFVGVLLNPRRSLRVINRD